MTMKKKVLTTLSVVLILGLAALGILAYLTSTDSDVNVMTLGNVKIEQQEYQRVQNDDGTYPMEVIDGSNSYKLEAFEQAKPLYPAVYPTNSENWAWKEDKWVQFAQVGANGGGMSVFTEPNAVDKFVFVKNTGKSDAYVRTLIAFECGSKTADEWSELVGMSNHFSWDDKETIGVITVDGSNYVVVEYVYKGRADKGYHANGVLPAGEVTQCSLGQVYMKSVATNEDVEALDGNDNGTYDILVLSQAVQTAGFADPQTALDTAFGDVTATNAKDWFGGMKAPELVSTADELANALAAGEDVALTEDIITEQIEIPAGKSATLDLNGYTLTGAPYTTDAGAESLNNVVNNYGELTITGEGTIRTRNLKNNVGAKLVIDGDINIIGGVAAGGSAIWNEGDCVINGATITQTNDWNYGIVNNDSGAKLVINDAKVAVNHGAIANNKGTAIINGGTFECIASGHVVYVEAGGVTINGGTFKHSQAKATAEGNVVVYATSTVVINGGSYDSVNAAFAYKAHSANITVNAGEFANKATSVYNNGSLNDFVPETSSVTTNAGNSVSVKGK